MINETEILEQLTRGVDFPPLSIHVSRTLTRGASRNVDAIIEIRSDDQSFEFAAEIGARSTPRAFNNALDRLERAAKGSSYHPILVVPYLRGAQLDELQQKQMSGIDLSGNGVVCIPGQLLVYRSGKPNKYPDSAPTKYAYRGTTSLVARTFLCRTRFESLADIKDEIQLRGGSVALSTISKALKRFESDLIVDRTDEAIRLRQPEKLLEKLSASYREPRVTRTLTCSTKQSVEELVAVAGEGNNVVLTGRSSIDAYAVTGRDEWPILYTRSIGRLVDTWGKRIEETSRFFDLELRQTADATVYFDARLREDLPYASPVQVFLEYSFGDKRDLEAAAQVKQMILRGLDK